MGYGKLYNPDVELVALDCGLDFVIRVLQVGLNRGCMMAHINKVMKSINAYDDSNCVDIFMRPDGTFGFEEYRRDVEDARGWFPIGHYSTQLFKSTEDALSAATKSIGWLCEKPEDSF